MLKYSFNKGSIINERHKFYYKFNNSTKFLFIIILLLFLFTESSAQNRWQLSACYGAISPGFLIVPPLGNHFEGRIYYNLSGSTQLSLSSGYSRWDENSLGYGGTKFKTIPLLAGINYSFPFKFFSPYLSAELGINYITRDYTLRIWTLSEDLPGVFKLVSSEPARESVTRFTFRFGIGIIVFLNRIIDLDISLRYDKIAYDFIYNYIYPNRYHLHDLYLYSLLFGINFKL